MGILNLCFKELLAHHNPDSPYSNVEKIVFQYALIKMHTSSDVISEDRAKKLIEESNKVE